MFKKSVFVMLLCVVALCADLSFAASYLPGSIEMLADLEGLPVIDGNVKDGMFSSTDPEGRGNDHGQFLRVDGDEYVMCEMEGPGVVTRIWSANAQGRVRIYVDDREKPVIDCPFKDIFQDKQPPFMSPISSTSSGGWYSYWPIGYSKYCKITATQDPEITKTHNEESKVREVSIPVKGVRELKLIVTDGGDGRDADRADWANARLTGADGSELFLGDITEDTKGVELVSSEQDAGKLEMNRNVLRHPIRMKDKTYEKGLGTNANSTVVYKLDGSFERFEAVVGIDDHSQINKKGTVVFKVVADGKEVYDSGLVGYRRFEEALYPSSLYYHINYRTYPQGTKVLPFSPVLPDSEKQKLERVLKVWSNTGVCPVERQRLDKTVSVTRTVPGGKSADLFNLIGTGNIYSFRVILKSKDPRAYRRTVLKMYWDEEESPSVWAPCGDFFGSGFGHIAFNSLPVGMGASSTEERAVNPVEEKTDAEIISPDECYCYWVMPFAKGARIEVENGSSLPVEISAEVTWRPVRSMSGNTGRFCTQYREEVGVKGKLVDLLHAKGIGKYVGVIMNVQGVAEISYLEGNEEYSIDGEEKPSMVGTGTEDFFNGGWYYNQGIFDCPLHGLTEKEKTLPGRTSQYRLQVPDSVTFTKSFDLVIQHGTNNIHLDDQYSSVTYYYLLPPTAQEYRPPKASEMNFPRKLLIRPNLPGKGAIGDDKARIVKLRGAVFADSVFEKAKSSCKKELAFWKDVSEGYQGTNKSLFFWWPTAYLITDENQDPRLKEPYNGDVIICSGASNGDYIELPVPEGADLPGKHIARYWLVAGPDYGTVRIKAGDEVLAESVDLYSPEVMPLELGPYEIAGDNRVTRIEVIGKNLKSSDKKFGVYAYKIQPVLMDPAAWSIIGPFDLDGREPRKSFAEALPPEKELNFDAKYKGKTGEVSWREMPPAMVTPDDYQAIDFPSGIRPAPWSIAYAQTFVQSPEDMDVQLSLGNSRWISLFVNGEKVHESIVTRPYKVGQDGVVVHLKKGTNNLLVKAGETQGMWKFSVRVLDKEGRPVPGVKFMRRPPK